MINLHSIPKEKTADINWARLTEMTININHNLEPLTQDFQQTGIQVAELEQRLQEMMREQNLRPQRRNEHLRFTGNRWIETPIPNEEQIFREQVFENWENHQPEYQLVNNGNGTYRARRIR